MQLRPRARGHSKRGEGVKLRASTEVTSHGEGAKSQLGAPSAGGNLGPKTGSFGCAGILDVGIGSCWSWNFYD